MIWRQKVRLCAGGDAVPAGLPRRLLRHLVIGHGLGIGSRVLDTGCDGGRLMRFLRSLHLEATGPHDPDADPAIAGCLPRAECPFDLVIVRDLPAPPRATYGADALRLMAQRLAQIAPGGCLTCLVHDDRAVEPTIAELERHLRVFPGTCITTVFSDTLLPVFPWQWITGHASHSGYATVTLRIPSRPIPCEEWFELAEAAAAHARRDVA